MTSHHEVLGRHVSRISRRVMSLSRSTSISNRTISLCDEADVSMLQMGHAEVTRDDTSVIHCASVKC